MLVTNSLTMQEITMENVEKTRNAMVDAAKDLAAAGAQFIVSSGTPVVTTRETGYDKKLIEQIRAAVGLPATTTATANIEALRAVGAKRLAVASPYTEEIASKLKRFLEGAGFEVAAITTLSKRSNYELSLVPEYVPYQHAKATFLSAQNADAIFLPCARWPAVKVIEQLEQDLGVPVIAAQQAWIWAALRGLNISTPIHGYGRLLREA